MSFPPLCIRAARIREGLKGLKNCQEFSMDSVVRGCGNSASFCNLPFQLILHLLDNSFMSYGDQRAEFTAWLVYLPICLILGKWPNFPEDQLSHQ